LRFLFRLAIYCSVLSVHSAATNAAGLPRSLIEVQIDGRRVSGRVAAADERDFWLLERDGRLSTFRMDAVNDFEELHPHFRADSVIELRDKLHQEFGRDFDYKTTAHYIVVASNGSAERYASLFEQIYRQFHTYFVARDFRINEPEFPLVAVVLPDRNQFNLYCRAEGATPQAGVVGFYLLKSNHVVLYDRAASGQSSVGDVDHVIVHEATHQIAFNTGVHSRIGQSPQWVVEGLAMLFEAEGIRVRPSERRPEDRINPERLDWFRRYSSQRRQAKSLAAFLRDDSLFRRSALDAYSEAWALIFYLMETHPVELARYLKVIAARDPLTAYEANSRLEDFCQAFGKDLEFIENGMLRFHARLPDQGR